MGLDIGYFGEIKYLERPEGLVKELWEKLLMDEDYTAAFGDGSAVIFALVDDLVNETEDKEVEAWILKNIKPIADDDGYCRLFFKW